MDKPITVVYEDLKQKLANLINNSGLPAFMIEPILQSFLYETREIAKRQYQLDKIQYEKFLDEEKAKD
jgi:preprotein translocase subunit SecB